MLWTVRMAMLVTALVASGCASTAAPGAQPAATATDPQSPSTPRAEARRRMPHTLDPLVPSGGRTLTTKYCLVDYNDDQARDAAELAGFVDHSLDAMAAALSPTPHTLTDDLACTVFQIRSPVPRIASDSLARARTPNTGREIQVYLLARSAYSPLGRTLVGTARDEAYQSHIVAHELSTVLFERVTRDKGRGWFFHDAPAWFTQGCEEYFSLVYSAPQNRAVLAQYIDRVRNGPQEVRFDGAGALTVRDNYVGGAVLVAFMHQTYGAERVRALLESAKATFVEAFADVIEPDRRVLAAKFDAWINQSGQWAPSQ
jgi:hypothetical protein